MAAFMTRGKKTQLIIALLGSVVSLALFWLALDTDPLRYRLRQYDAARRLHQARTGPMKVFSRDYVRWTLNGRPSLAEVTAALHRHEEELVRFGYFERREFALKDLDRLAEAQLAQMISGGTFTNNLRIMRISPQENLFRITACSGDMKAIEAIFAEFRAIEAENARRTSGSSQ